MLRYTVCCPLFSAMHIAMVVNVAFACCAICVGHRRSRPIYNSYGVYNS